MSLEVQIKGEQLEFSDPKSVFEVPGGHDYEYQPTADGQRFLLTVPVGEEKPFPLNLIVNWPASLGHH